MFIPWFDENLNFNAFHNNIKKLNKKVSLSTELGTDKLRLLIRKLVILPVQCALCLKRKIKINS